MRALCFLVLMPALALGCPPPEPPAVDPQPPAQPSDDDVQADAPGEPGAEDAPAGEGEEGAEAEGDAVADAEGDPEEADAALDEAEAAGPPAADTRILPPGFVIGAGQGVLLSGTVTYTEDPGTNGQLTMEVLPAKGGTGPLHVELLDGKGDWSLRVPKNLGDVNLLFYFDGDNNGPSAGETSFDYPEPISIGSSDVTGLAIDFGNGDPQEVEEPEGVEVPAEDKGDPENDPDAIPNNPEK